LASFPGLAYSLRPSQDSLSGFSQNKCVGAINETGYEKSMKNFGQLGKTHHFDKPGSNSEWLATMEKVGIIAFFLIIFS
jgi:hypothetical protein